MADQSYPTTFTGLWLFLFHFVFQGIGSKLKFWDGSKIFHMTAEVGWRNIYFLANGSVHSILSQKTLLFSASNAIKITIPLMGPRILDAQRLTFFQDRFAKLFRKKL